jgi:protocatechuate 3,4-dioxygenase beta subunit
MRRRTFLSLLAGSSPLIWTPGVFADVLTLTPKMTEGPFYPDRLPLDQDNDLLLVSDSTTPAIGEITHLTGRVLDAGGQPIRNAFVEIWQCDQNGAYLHSGTGNQAERDPHFQGYGRFLTDSEGNYRFRTIKPVPYPGRTPHIHFGVSRHGQRVLTTQLFVKGHPQNERDGILRSIQDPKAKENVLGDFRPVPGSMLGELAVSFDLILGRTPGDPDDEDGHHGVGKSDRASGKGMGPPPGRPRPAPPERP